MRKWKVESGKWKVLTLFVILSLTQNLLMLVEENLSSQTLWGKYIIPIVKTINLKEKYKKAQGDTVLGCHSERSEEFSLKANLVQEFSGFFGLHPQKDGVCQGLAVMLNLFNLLRSTLNFQLLLKRGGLIHA